MEFRRTLVLNDRATAAFRTEGYNDVAMRRGFSSLEIDSEFADRVSKIDCSIAARIAANRYAHAKEDN